MKKEFEALKRIRQETIPATYNPDFDKGKCCDIIEKALLKAQKNENKLEYDNIIKNKDDLLNQLESLKEEAIYMMKGSIDDIFQKDLHALRIVINYLKEMK